MPKKPKKDKQQLFEETCRRMEGEGYRRTDLTISAKKLNLIALLVIVPIIGIPCVLFILRWNLLAESGVAIEVSAWTLVAFFAGVVVHELIHGLVWSFFCKDGCTAFTWVSAKNPHPLLPLRAAAGQRGIHRRHAGRRGWCWGCCPSCFRWCCRTST